MSKQKELTHSSTDWNRLGRAILKKGGAVVAAGLVAGIAFAAIKGAKLFNKTPVEEQAPSNSSSQTYQPNKPAPQGERITLVESNPNGEVSVIVSDKPEQKQEEQKPQEKPADDTSSKNSLLTPTINEQPAPYETGKNDTSSQADSSNDQQQTEVIDNSSSTSQESQTSSQVAVNPTIKTIEAGEAIPASPEE